MQILEKVDELKHKFYNFFVHRKKLRALQNYSEASNQFTHHNYLGLIKKCLADGFLTVKEADFLSYMLEKYEINFLDWSHRTLWLKEEMRKMARNPKTGIKAKGPQPHQFFFNWEKAMPTAVSVPVYLIAQQKSGTAQQKVA